MTYANCFLIPKPKFNPDVRIFCFPYAGGSASTYLPWAKDLPNNVELVAVQPPGRANRISESCYLDMTSLVGEIINPILSMIDRPYILFGHSLGSWVAFELLVQLKKLGAQLPIHFVASGSKAPHLQKHKKKIHNLSDDDFITELKTLNGTPLEVLENDPLMSLLLPQLKADFRLAETYRYSANILIDCALTVLAGKADDHISTEELEAWKNLFSYTPAIHTISGDHFFIDSSRMEVVRIVNNIIRSSIPCASMSF